MEHWFYHLQHSCIPPENIGDPERIQMVDLLAQFLKEEDVLRRWCQYTEWSFYSPSVIDSIGQWVEAWSAGPDVFGGLAPNTKAWVTLSRARSPALLEPVARVNGREGLLKNSWHARSALSVIAQIKRLMDNGGKGHPLESLPPGNLAEVARWAVPKQTSMWHYNLASCLMELGHSEPAIQHFEMALRIDRSCIEARSGLAHLHKKDGRFAKSIELEKENAGTILHRLGSSDPKDKIKMLSQLASSYEAIAGNYEKLEEPAQTLEHWAEAANTKEISIQGTVQYVSCLAEHAGETAWKDIIQLLQMLESKHEDGFRNRLSKIILELAWGANLSAEFFDHVSEAAKKTSESKWLQEAYKASIMDSQSHVTALSLKVRLAKLSRTASLQPMENEILIEELVEFATLHPHSDTPQLLGCKSDLAKDYFRICVRKASEAGFTSPDADRYLKKVSDLCNCGIYPYEADEKVLYGERSFLYLALLQHQNNNSAAATRTLQPYLEACQHIILQPVCEDIVLRASTRMLFALDKMRDAATFLKYVHSRKAWLCENCWEYVPRNRQVAMCRYCFICLCETCFQNQGHSLKWTGCLPRHRLLEFPAIKHSASPKATFKFRGKRMTPRQAIEVLKNEWTAS